MSSKKSIDGVNSNIEPFEDTGTDVSLNLPMTFQDTLEVDGATTFNSAFTADDTSATNTINGFLKLTRRNLAVLDVRDGQVSNTPILTVDTNAAAQVRVSSVGGGASRPDLSFQGDPDTGVYLDGTNRLGLSCGGTGVLECSSSGVEPQLPINAQAGSAATPSYSFIGDTNTGMYRDTADKLGFSTGGGERMIIGISSIRSNEPFSFPDARAADGNAAAPSYTFTADTNTGLYRAAENTVGISTGGTERMSVSSNLLYSQSTVLRHNDKTSINETINLASTVQNVKFTIDIQGGDSGNSTSGLLFRYTGTQANGAFECVMEEYGFVRRTTGTSGSAYEPCSGSSTRDDTFITVQTSSTTDQIVVDFTPPGTLTETLRSVFTIELFGIYTITDYTVTTSTSPIGGTPNFYYQQDITPKQRGTPASDFYTTAVSVDVKVVRSGQLVTCHWKNMSGTVSATDQLILPDAIPSSFLPTLNDVAGFCGVIQSGNKNGVVELDISARDLVFSNGVRGTDFPSASTSTILSGSLSWVLS